MEEIWKEIEGYENYEVSNMGRVRSIDRTIYQEGFGERKLKGRIVKPWHNGHGYYKVCLGSYATPDGKRKHPTEFVHRLVAYAFLENPNNYPAVDHINFDRGDNRVTNLRWVSHRTNILHSVPNKPLATRAISVSNTGAKYISKKVRVRYEVALPLDRYKRLQKTFNTFEEAMEFRNEKAKELGIEVFDDNRL